MSIAFEIGVLLLGLIPQDGGEAARAQVEALAGTGRDAALDALAKTPPEFAVPALVECLAEEPPEHAWQALRAMSRVARTSGTKDGAWRAALRTLTKIVTDDEQDEARRAIAALAIGTQAKRAKGSADELVGVFDVAGAHTLHVCAAFGLVEIGGASSKQLDKLVRKGKNSGSVLLAVLSLGALGVEAKKSSDELLGLVRRKNSLTASVVSRAAWLASERVGAKDKARSAAWDERLELERGRTWRAKGARLNYGGLIPNDPQVAVEYMVSQMGLRLSMSPASLSLPKEFDRGLGGGTNFTLADFVRSLFAHLYTEWLIVHGELAQDAFATWPDWQGRTQSLLGTCELMWAVAPIVK